MRRRVENGVGARARAALAAHWDEMDATYGASFPDAPFRAQAARVRSGAPLEVAGWELHDLVPGVSPDDRYLLGRDNSVTVVRHSERR